MYIYSKYFSSFLFSNYFRWYFYIFFIILNNIYKIKVSLFFWKLDKKKKLKFMKKKKIVV